MVIVDCLKKKNNNNSKTVYCRYISLTPAKHSVSSVTGKIGRLNHRIDEIIIETDNNLYWLLLKAFELK